MEGIGEGFAEGGELAGFFALDGVGGEGGVDEDVGEDFGDGVCVRGEAAGLDEEGVVAGVCGEGCAEGFEGGGDFLGGAGRGAFVEGGGEELVETVVFGVFGGEAGEDCGLEVDEGDAVVGEESDAEAVREGVGLDVRADAGGFTPGGGGWGVEGIEGGLDEKVGGEFLGDAADVCRGDGLDGGEVAAGEVEVACFVPVGGEVGGAA